MSCMVPLIMSQMIMSQMSAVQQQNSGLFRDAGAMPPSTKEPEYTVVKFRRCTALEVSMASAMTTRRGHVVENKSHVSSSL